MISLKEMGDSEIADLATTQANLVVRSVLERKSRIAFDRAKNWELIEEERKKRRSETKERS
ncbi:hypothetical protein [Psychromicrobium lacuslunae]|uniref:Uncharacterized protein n=1 Tax=Psychromicrobium lacuslunae TaxID=1618207 RepID=A0A0D4C134_9MICC|nr:hypothetical protein [Psychromicrobium lacuslunae]AJT42402.1 hypothetical protein UM93_14495 [Psychromicrobium lacuslunae]